MNGSKIGRPTLELTDKEREFSRLLATGMGSIQAARLAFEWQCTQGTKEYSDAKNLAKAPRIKEEVARVKEQISKETTANFEVSTGGVVKWDQVRVLAYQRLKQIRDNKNSPSATRLRAIEILEKLQDPNKDVNLIMLWLDILWRGARVHCPSCHKTYPLNKVFNAKLNQWEIDSEKEPIADIDDQLALQTEILKLADRRKTPHKSQIPALIAKERHVVGMGAARSGKSWLLGALGFLNLLVPGVEIWILAKTYDLARSEAEYLQAFFQSVFYPHHDKLYSITNDIRSGEMRLTTKWGSELRVRSATSKGTITGRELEVALVAEPGWLPEDIYEELRARMSSRLGRIFVFGTPKGNVGFLARMVNMIGRDETGRIIRRTPAQRLLSAGCPWGSSMFIYTIDPKDNPGYVQSELKAARAELTDAEYASEFEGKMVDVEGRKFGALGEGNLHKIERGKYNECVWVLGIDQGERNFGACLVGWDGRDAYVAWEFFGDGESTIKANLLKLRPIVPAIIRTLGGNPDNWRLTVLDQNPPAWNILDEMDKEGHKWPTTVTYRHINQPGAQFGDNWRKECSEFVNQMAQAYRLHFDEEGGVQLFDQLMKALDVPMDPTKDKIRDSSKGWKINDPWHGDHVADAFMFAMWCIFSNQLETLEPPPGPPKDPWVDAKNAFDAKRIIDEKRDMMAFNEWRSLRPGEENAIMKKYLGTKPDTDVHTGLGRRTPLGYEDV